MSINTVNIVSEKEAYINNNKTVITNWTYELNVNMIDTNGVTISNNIETHEIIIKFINTNNYNKNQILIKGNNITIDGTSNTLDLSNSLSYNGLIKVGDNYKDIIIKNIKIKINNISTLNGYSRGWICQGNMKNTIITFINCNVNSDDSINIINGSNGGICGGTNGFGTDVDKTNIVKLKFDTCNVTANNGIIIGKNIMNNNIGGICGGSNVVSTGAGSTTNIELEFNQCNVTVTNGDINIGCDDGGIICGGGNGYNNGYITLNTSGGICNIYVNLNFINCNVESSTILINNFVSGGICGGGNGSGNNYNLKGNVNLNFTNCILFSKVNNITINGNSSGGICGGYNGMYNNGRVVLEITFNNCNLESSSGIIIDTTKNGGICGGTNAITVSFNNCFLYYSNFITFEGQDISAVTLFNLITDPEPLYIIGTSNSNTLHLDNLSRISSSNPSGLLYNSSTYTVGHPTETIIPSIVNQGIFPLTYSITPGLPAWIVLDVNTGIITVNPSQYTQSVSYVVTITYNSIQTIQSNNFNIEIINVPPSGLLYSTTNNIFTVNSVITPITASFNGPPPTGILTYSITPPIPGGLNLNNSTGEITGTPLIQQDAVIYTVTVQNITGSTTAKISIQIEDVIPSVLSYSTPTNIFTVNSVITSITPTLTNPQPTGTLTYSITPPIPGGLTFNNATGVITGTPLHQQSNTSYNISVSNASGSTSTNVTIKINDVVPDGLSYPPNLQFTVNKEVNIIILPTINNQNTVTGLLTYSIDPSIPEGLTFNDTTGAITGTPIEEQSPTIYTIKVSNLSGFASNTTIIEIIHLYKRFVPDPPNLWSRATIDCVNYDMYSQEELAMRRKAEILKYKGNKNSLTKKQQFSRNVNGNGPLGKKVWATQNVLGSNPNVFNLPQVGNTLILCPKPKINNILTTIIGNQFGFGNVVSINGDGNTLAIGSNAEQKIYIYTKNINNSWTLTTTLEQPEVDSLTFGTALQLSYDGNTLIAGARLWPNNTNEYGRIYIYEKLGLTWTNTFVYNGNNLKQRFGNSVSISNDGSVIAVGSQFNDNLTFKGKIEVFERNGPYWNSAAPTGPLLIATGFTGERLSFDGLFLNGNGNFIASTTFGNKIYLYKKTGASWVGGNTIQTLIISSNYNVYFDTNANYLCIGTLTENIAYVYKYNTTTNLFEHQQSFNNLDGSSSTVIIISPDGKYIAIGLPDVNTKTGVVYIYKIIDNTWNLIEKIYGDRINGYFGKSLSFNNDGSTLVIGASSFDTSPGKIYIYLINENINTNNIKCAPSSSSDVPGNSVLCYDLAVPLVNYQSPQRTYLAGGTKWPQSTWKPGDNGFPRGKKGMNMLFQ